MCQFCVMASQKIMNAQNVVQDIGHVTECLQHHHFWKGPDDIGIGMALKYGNVKKGQ